MIDRVLDRDRAVSRTWKDRGVDCPMCSAEMVEGSIVGRSPGVKFKASRDLLGDLTGVPLTSGFFNHSARAFRCGSCGTVVVPPGRSNQR